MAFAYHFRKRFFVVSSTAAYQQVYLAVVRRKSRSLDNRHAIFSMHPLLGVRLFPSLGKSAQAFGSGQTACVIACIGVDHGDLRYSD
jgi:hypothetical protein